MIRHVKRGHCGYIKGPILCHHTHGLTFQMDPVLNGVDPCLRCLQRTLRTYAVGGDLEDGLVGGADRRSQHTRTHGSVILSAGPLPVDAHFDQPGTPFNYIPNGKNQVFPGNGQLNRTLVDRPTET